CPDQTAPAVDMPPGENMPRQIESGKTFSSTYTLLHLPFNWRFHLCTRADFHTRIARMHRKQIRRTPEFRRRVLRNGYEPVTILSVRLISCYERSGHSFEEIYSAACSEEPRYRLS